MSTRFLKAAPLAFVVGAVTLLSSCQDATAPPSIPEATYTAPRMATSVEGRFERQLIANHYIVVLRNGEADVNGRAKTLVGKTNGKVMKSFTEGVKGFAAILTASEAEELARDPSVAYVEQDQVVSVQQRKGSEQTSGKGGKPSGSTTRTSGATQRKAPWSLDRMDQSALPLDGIYTYTTTGAGVAVYIIDSGIRPTHVEFAGRLGSGFDAVGDGNGTADCHWHGTHVAGIVGGSTYGVAKGVTLHPVRVLGCDGRGSTSAVIAGIDWVIANRVGPAVINLSVAAWYSAAMNEAVERAVASGVVVVAAAGNSTADACLYSPSSALGAITVAATTAADAQSNYTNFGSCVDIMAPGDGINSTSNETDTSTRFATGTSMASPHAAGAAALFLQLNPAALPSDVAQGVFAKSTPNLLTAVTLGTANLLLRAQ